MLSRIAGLKNGLRSLPVLLALAHTLFMLWIGYTWWRAVQEYGVPAGPEASIAYWILEWVDFPIYRVVDWIMLTALRSGESFQVGLVFRWIGVETFGDIELRIRWPLLLLLGGTQWFIIGLAISFGRQVKERYAAAKSD